MIHQVIIGTTQVLDLFLHGPILILEINGNLMKKSNLTITSQQGAVWNDGVVGRDTAANKDDQRKVLSVFAIIFSFGSCQSVGCFWPGKILIEGLFQLIILFSLGLVHVVVS